MDTVKEVKRWVHRTVIPTDTYSEGVGPHPDSCNDKGYPSFPSLVDQYLADDIFSGLDL